jgi:superoxide reductase
MKNARLATSKKLKNKESIIMEGLVCKICGYVSLDGKTDICPVCHMKNVFEQKDDAYKTSDFKAETGESEKKHIPCLSIKQQCELIDGGKGLRVKVGEITHPMTPEHFIGRITFYLNNKFLGSVMLTPDAMPAAVLMVKGETKGKIQVMETCNLHGRWLNEAEIN